MSARKVPFEIDPEFQALLPPLTEEEKATLEQQLLSRDLKIVLTLAKINRRCYLIDGHNRLEICQQHKLPYSVEVIRFPNKELAKQWMVDHQLGRRNLTDQWRAYFIGKEYLAEKKAHGGKRAKSRADGEPLKSRKKTSKKVAEKHGVAESTVKRDAEFAKEVDRIGRDEGAEAKNKVLGGAEPIKEVVKKARARKAKKPKPGEEKYRWQEWERKFAPVARAHNDIAEAYPAEKDSAEYTDYERHAAGLLESFHTWRQRLTTA